MVVGVKAVSAALIESKIHFLRSCRVMLDADLAALYEVDTRHLTRQVRRNADRFPEDFAFQLTRQEVRDLKCQIGTSSSWGGRRRSRPLAFTEQGVAMLSSVLRSKRAVMVNIEIMRAFVKLRRMLIPHADLAQKLEMLEKKYDARFRVVFLAIRRLMATPEPSRRQIGFRPDERS